MHAIGLILISGKLASTGNLEEDVGRLCEQVYKLLGYMQEPMFSGNLVSLTQTVKSTLNLVTCAAMFLEDYFKPKLNGELRTHFLTIRGFTPMPKISPILPSENQFWTSLADNLSL